jgi:hypothetical protein
MGLVSTPNVLFRKGHLGRKEEVRWGFVVSAVNQIFFYASRLTNQPNVLLGISHGSLKWVKIKQEPRQSFPAAGIRTVLAVVAPGVRGMPAVGGWDRQHGTWLPSGSLAPLEALPLESGLKILDGCVAFQPGKTSKYCINCVSLSISGWMPIKGQSRPPQTSESSLANSAMRGQTANTSGFLGHTVCVFTQLYHL